MKTVEDEVEEGNVKEEPADKETMKEEPAEKEPIKEELAEGEPADRNKKFKMYDLLFLLFALGLFWSWQKSEALTVAVLTLLVYRQEYLNKFYQKFYQKFVSRKMAGVRPEDQPGAPREGQELEG